MPPSEATLLKQAQAAAWALNQIGRQDYYNLCQKFIENAYGTGGQFGSAAAAGNALNMKTDPYEADVGDLVFFRPDPSNGGAGHVGINIGNGQMVSSTNKGVTVDNFLTNGYWKNLFVGIGDPPDQWQGRTDAKDLVSGAATLVAQGKAAAGNATAAAWGAAAPYAQQLLTASSKHGVPVNVLAGLLIQESGGDPRAVSRAGAQGLMQFMPGTARGLGIDPFDPAQAIDGGARYLKQLADQSGGDWAQAVGKYNAGPAGNLNNAETRNHITKVMQFAEGIGGSMMQIPPPGGPFGGPPNLPGGPGGPPPPGGNRNRDRNRQTGTSPLAAMLARLQEIGGDLQRLPGDLARDLPPMPNIPLPDIRSGQRRADGGTPYAPGVPGMEGITSGGGGTPQAPGQTVQINVDDLREAIASGGSGLQDFLRAMLQGAANATPVGQAAAAAAAIAGRAPGVGPPRPPSWPRGEDSPQTSPEPIGPPGPPAATTRDGSARPRGWVDPSRYSGTDRAQIEQANRLLEQIEEAERRVAANPNDFVAQEALTNAQNAFRAMGPTLASIESRTSKDDEGTILSGTTPSSSMINIIRKKPDGSGYELVQIPNPNPEPSTADVAAAASRYGSDVSRANAQDAAAASRYGSDQSLAGTRESAAASRYGSDRSLEGTRYAADAGERNARLNALTQLGTTEMTTTTQRVTAALSAAVEQQRTRIDAAIRAGDLTLRDGTERFNQWYKQNVEAPLAILQQQRETEQYKLNQQNAITQRATGQAEHERGLAQIGGQIWNSAANAYGQTIPLTVGEGWGQGFQNNLRGQGFTPNQGATYNVSESMDQFATRKVAEMLQGVSPYAASIMQAQGQIGNPGQAMSGQQMTGLQQQATGVASNALANPFQMPDFMAPQMPQPIDVGAFAGVGANNGSAIASAINAATQAQRPVPALPPPDDYSYQSGSGYGRG